MTDLTDFEKTDDVDDVLASDINRMLGGIMRDEFTNAVTMSGTVELVDADCPIQSMNCNGANRIVEVPVAADANHPFFIVNATGSAYTLTVKNADASATLTTLDDGESALLIPSGVGTYKVVAGGSWGSIGGTLSSQVDINPPAGFLWNGKISATVSSNNLTVALKGMDGNDPSSTNPVYCRIGDTVRSITGALSVTKNAATNWCNSGSAELATKEVDYFVYLGYNATDGVVIGFSRMPYGQRYDDFSATTTNEKYCAISTITNAAAADYYQNIGRFAATLSAGAGYTWTVPTFTAANLIQRPIFYTRYLTFAITVAAESGSITTVGTTIGKYRIEDREITVTHDITITTNGTGAGSLWGSFPFAGISSTTVGMTVGRETAVSGKFLMALPLTTQNIRWRTYDNLYPGADTARITGTLKCEWA